MFGLLGSDDEEPRGGESCNDEGLELGLRTPAVGGGEVSQRGWGDGKGILFVRAGSGYLPSCACSADGVL